MRELQKSLDLCTFCPRLCSDRCPVSLVEARETVTPQAKMATFGRLRAEVQPWTAAGAAPLYACTGCGACTTVCLHGVEPGLRLIQGRGEAQDHSAVHPALAGLVPAERLRMDATGAALREAPAAPAAVAAPGAAAGSGSQRALSQRAAYLPACQGGGAGAVADARRARRLLRAVADPGEGPPEVLTVGCAGYALYAAGQVEAFRVHAERLAQATAGHELVLTSCSLCAWLMREQYPAHGVPLRGRVRHIAEHLAPRAARLPVVRSLEAAVYHDPCHLGRRMGVYDEPRQLLQRVVNRPLEFPERREASACCGAAGLVPQTAPETARGMARERLRDVPEAFAEAFAEATAETAAAERVVVTGCAGCQGQLAEAAAGGARVVDLLVLLDEALGPE